MKRAVTPRTLLSLILALPVSSALAGPLVVKSKGGTQSCTERDPVNIELSNTGQKSVTWEGVNGYGYLIHFSGQCTVYDSTDNGTSLGLSIQAKSPGKNWKTLEPTIVQEGELDLLPYNGCSSRNGQDHFISIFVVCAVQGAIEWHPKAEDTRQPPGSK